MLHKVIASLGSLRKAVKELQGLKQCIVTGAAAATDITVAGIKFSDAIVGAVNLTDLTDVPVTAAKALWTGAGNYDAVLEIKTVGLHGNDWTFALIGDSPGAGGVTIDIKIGLKTIVVHYESNVSTVANVNTAIAALATYFDVVDVKTAGTEATVLTAPADDTVARAFAGGLDTVANELPVITSDGNIQFPLSSTADKKLLVTYYTIPE